MKRKNEKVPGFDEIIFENRNKSYGAYDLRKRYKSTTSLSILGGMALGVILVSALSLNTEKGSASPGLIIIPVAMSAPVTEKVAPAEIKPRAELTKTIQNLRPEVTEDTTMIVDPIPTADQLNNTVKDGLVTDTVQYTSSTDVVIPPEPDPVVIVQEMPEFPGGNDALMKFVSENLRYPDEASSMGIQGKVILKFVVKSDGSVDRIEILRGIDPALDNEALRVVKTLPKFKPGRQAGVAVPVWFMLPVTFRIATN
jgi:periplasmic protein TonB